MNSLNWDQLYILSDPDPLPVDRRPLTDFPLIIVVGLTGAGKTTVLENLDQSGLPITLLPNRREITDKLIIARLQHEAGQKPHPVTDRLERFSYTARYRTKFPGGVAHALSQVAIRPPVTNHLIFDGLRGLEEVKGAVAYFPSARFILLEAPDIVRLNRLLKRRDRFDTASLPNSPINGNVISALRNISGIQTIFSDLQLKQIAELSNYSPVEDLLEKVAIIVKERRNYDSRKAGTYLVRTLPPEQVLVIDTASQTAESVATEVADWLVSV